MASINFPREEEEIISRWREIKAFETQVRNGSAHEGATRRD